MYVGAAALGRSNDPIFRLSLRFRFFDTGKKFADKLGGGVVGWQASALVRSLHSGRAWPWTCGLGHLPLTEHEYKSRLRRDVR